MVKQKNSARICCEISNDKKIQKDLVSGMKLVEEVPEITKRAVAGNFGCLTFVL